MHPDPRPGRRGGAASPARPWAVAWQEALYGRHGFYRTHAPAQHFHTSAQGIPGAGRVLAEALAALCRRHDLDSVVDLGAGRGELLARVRQQAPDLRLHGIDVVDRPAGAAVDRWTRSPGGASLPSGLRELRSVLVLAHEWLDVVPCPVVVRDGQGVWRGLAVGADGTEVLGPPLTGADLAWARRWLGPRVRRAEVGRPRDLAAEDLVGRVVDGVVLLVDYGHEAADRPTDGTLTGYRAGRQVDPVPDGRRDLTAHVAWDSLVDRLRGGARPGGRRVEVTATTQRQALLDLLSDDGSDPLAPVPHGLARADPAAYLDLLARRATLTALTAPGGLGDFRWALVRVPRASGAPPSGGPAAGRGGPSSH